MTAPAPARWASSRPLRLWPGVVAASLLALTWIVLPLFAPSTATFGVIGGALGALLIVAWWMLFSRARWTERLVAPALMFAAGFATWPLLHASIQNGMMGWLFTIFVLPLFGLALVIWAAAGRRLSGVARVGSLAAAVFLASGSMTLVRTGGVSGDGVSDFHWRWTTTPEERLLAQSRDMPAPLPLPAAGVSGPVSTSGEGTAPPAGRATDPVPKAPAAAPIATTTDSAAAPEVPAAIDWPGFRGPLRDSIVRGVRIETDWSRTPPAEIWRRPIGPGWSSFAVSGSLIYTQEQRGEEEVVSCYRLETGEPVWMHRDPIRFWESNAGAGPRATPTLSGTRVYALGATGVLNALDARTGARAWSRDVAAELDRTIPDWGIASSPLVVGDVVVVAVAGQLAAYDAATGAPRWTGPGGGGGYSSPHLVTIDGVAQVLLLRGSRTTSVLPADGTLLWEDIGQVGTSIVQPAMVAGTDVLVGSGDAMGGMGIRRLAVSRGPAGWIVEERWTSRGLKPYFNDFVVHKGHAYGFDGSILSAIDLTDGARTWKGGRYGHGQLVLLPDQDLLLVLSEEGELALVAASPDGHRELARFKAIDGKTWNHPVLVGDTLLVRNGEEMAAFRLARAGR